MLASEHSKRSFLLTFAIAIMLLAVQLVFSQQALAEQQDRQGQQALTASSRSNLETQSGSVKLSAATVKTVKGQFRDGGVKKVISKSAKYTDAYFSRNSASVQKDLAKLSMLASASAYKSTYAVSLMKQCGFKFGSKDPKYQRIKPTRADNDHVSYALGWKKIGKTTVVAVWVKGTSGDYEWVSNFNLGKGRTHTGFSLAEAELNKSITKYLKDNGVSGSIKWWITGHSRGAAVANLFAKRKTDQCGKKNVYAYTFATPRVSTAAKKSGYENIFNYINPGDFITEVAPAKWGYERYGKDITFTSATKSSMTSKFKKLTGKKYAGFGVKGKNSLLKAFLRFAKGSNVKAYYKKQKPSGVKPVTFCQRGLGYVLAGEARGFAYAAGIASVDDNAAFVLGKLIYDGKATAKFAHAHCQASYLSWLDAMYTKSDAAGKYATLGTGCYAITTNLKSGDSAKVVASSDAEFGYQFSGGDSGNAGSSSLPTSFTMHKDDVLYLDITEGSFKFYTSEKGIAAQKAFTVETSNTDFWWAPEN